MQKASSLVVAFFFSRFVTCVANELFGSVSVWSGLLPWLTFSLHFEHFGQRETDISMQHLWKWWDVGRTENKTESVGQGHVARRISQLFQLGAGRDVLDVVAVVISMSS